MTVASVTEEDFSSLVAYKKASGFGRDENGRHLRERERRIDDSNICGHPQGLREQEALG